MDEKDKIRERYKGVNNNKTFVIPAKSQSSIYDDFFGIKNANVNIKGLTAGDFATVKKKADFLCVAGVTELSKMLQDEVKLKKFKELQDMIGF
ncbi:MAG: hypothetical protein KIC80_00620 [Brachyspira sp.]|mgnify:FL=1|jgi:hypothetical protein|nr:hypothetical protein [Brachyspira sp.]